MMVDNGLFLPIMIIRTILVINHQTLADEQVEHWAKPKQWPTKLMHFDPMSKIDSILQIWIEASVVAVSFADARRNWKKWRLGWVQSPAACSQLQPSAAKIYWSPISAISFLGHFFSGALWVTTVLLWSSLGCFFSEANSAPLGRFLYQLFRVFIAR